MVKGDTAPVPPPPGDTNTGMEAKSKTIHLVRHGQGEHNVTMDPNLPDPLLTDLGRRQCESLLAQTEGKQQQTAQLVIISPLRRALETTVIAFKPLIERIGAQKAIVLDTLQETGVSSSSTPTSPLGVLRNSQDAIYAHLNYDLVSPGKRVKAVLAWMHEREENEIVLVSHGDFMNDLVSYRPSGQRVPPTEWDNCELITFTLQPEHPDDDHSGLILVRAQENEARVRGQAAPTVSQMTGPVPDDAEANDGDDGER